MAKGVTIDLIVDPKGAIAGLDKASDKSSKFTGVLGTLGKYGATAIAAVGTAAVGAATALTAATLAAGKYADEILTTATNTNISTDALQAYKYAAELIDVPFDTFVKSQGKFTKAQFAASEGTKAQSEAFARLGLSATDSSGALVDSTELYWEAVDALGAVENETERTALAQQLFGRGGAEMNSIIAQGSEGFARLTEEARKNGAILSGEQLAKLGAFDDKMQSLTSTVDAAKNAFGLTLLPVLDQLAGSGGSALGEFTSALLDADGDLTKAGPAFEKLGTNVAEALTTAIPKVLEVGTSIVNGLIEGIVSQGPSLIKTAIPLLVTFVTGILGMLPAILDAGLKILIALVQGIAAALPVLIPAAVDAIIGLVGALIDNLPLLIDAGLQLVVGLATGLIDALPKLIDSIPALITGIITAIVAAQPALIQAGVTLFVALIGALPQIITSVVKAVPEIIKGLVKAFTSPATLKALAGAGRELIEGLWAGIKGAGDWLWRQISGFFGSQIQQIRDLLGIHSPSTVFAGFGKNLVQGLAVGISGASGLAVSAVRGLSSDVQTGFSASLTAVDGRAAVAAGVGASGGGTVVQVSLPVTNSFVGDRDDFARYVTAAIQNGLRTGVVPANWNTK